MKLTNKYRALATATILAIGFSSHSFAATTPYERTYYLAAEYDKQRTILSEKYSSQTASYKAKWAEEAAVAAKSGDPDAISASTRDAALRQQRILAALSTSYNSELSRLEQRYKNTMAHGPLASNKTAAEAALAASKTPSTGSGGGTGSTGADGSTGSTGGNDQEDPTSDDSDDSKDIECDVGMTVSACKDTGISLPALCDSLTTVQQCQDAIDDAEDSSSSGDEGEGDTGYESECPETFLVSECRTLGEEVPSTCMNEWTILQCESATTPTKDEDTPGSGTGTETGAGTGTGPDTGTGAETGPGTGTGAAFAVGYIGKARSDYGKHAEQN